MKTTRTGILLVCLSLITYNSNAQQKQISPEERAYVLKSLNDTEAGVFKAIKGLSDEQLKFKASPDKWNVEECVKHIATAEKTLWAMVEESLKQSSNPDKRAEIKFSDKDLVAAVEDRSHKSKTFAALEPANSHYASMADALADFKANREKLIAFMKNTQEDLRNHVSVLPIGTYDAYQFILLISAHSNRHTQQIDEVKADANFPKN